MFATLLGALPRPPLPDGAGGAGAGRSGAAHLDALVARVVEAQDDAGLEPITDGRLRWRGYAGPMAGLAGLESVADVPGADGARLVLRGSPAWSRPLSVDAWRFAATATGRAVKQALPGPYSLGRRLAAGSARATGPAAGSAVDRATGGPDGLFDRSVLTLALAAALRAEVLALADAGCRLVEIEERDAHEIGTDEAERALFREAHLALTDGIAGIHLSLAIVGGNADTAGAETILAGPYASLAVDLIDGPDNWRLVRAVPGERGIVVGAMSARDASVDGPELLLWAAGYAASSNGRGRDRVGLATSGSLGSLSWEIAERKIRRLGEAARLATMPAAEAAPHLDPRAIDIRSAAAGRYVPRTRRGRRPSA
ncbi:MAG TPA: hypothetical protein VFX65_13860 [Candidatus Limnocylindrales bacterium]|nr:hypothetical protein [Candidatus Limnocylindrales bacterium]